MSAKKLDQADLDSIMKIRQKYMEYTNTVGMISTDEHAIEQQLEQIKLEKSKVFNDIDTLRQEESDLMNSLKEKYGDGQINLEDGTFVPVP